MKPAPTLRSALLSLLIALFSSVLTAETLHRPFILSSLNGKAELAAKSAEVRGKLSHAGFSIVGDYAPQPQAQLLVVTNEALKGASAGTPYGGYASAVRVALTELDGTIQVSYTNPSYLAHAYHLASDLSGVRHQLRQALGEQMEFGALKGLSAEELAGFRGMSLVPSGIPFFDQLSPAFEDQLLAAEYAGYAEAVEQIAARIAAGQFGARAVYRIDNPASEITLFGLALEDKSYNDQWLLTEVLDNTELKSYNDQWLLTEVLDNTELKSTALLPFEILVQGNQSYVMPGKYRISLFIQGLGSDYLSALNAAAAAEKLLARIAGAEAKEEVIGID